MRAARAHGRTRIVLGGGVACNRTLAEAMTAAAGAVDGRVFAPSPRLATDNAAMIGAAGLFRFEAGQRDTAALNAHSALPIPGLVAAPAAAR